MSDVLSAEWIENKLGKKLVPRFYKESLFLVLMNFVFLIIIEGYVSRFIIFIKGLDFNFWWIINNLSAAPSIFFYLIVLTFLIFYPIFLSTKHTLTSNQVPDSKKPFLLWGGVITFAFIGIGGGIHSLWSIVIDYNISTISLFDDGIIFLISVITISQSFIMIFGMKHVNIEKKVVTSNSGSNIIILEIIFLLMFILIGKFLLHFYFIANMLSAFTFTNFFIQFLHHPGDAILSRKNKDLSPIN